MRNPLSDTRQVRLTGALALLAIVLAVLVHVSPAMRSVEYAVKNAWYRLAPASEPDSNIVVIEIDDTTIEALAQDGKLPRDQVAVLIERLMSGSEKARVVVLDMYFEGASISNPEYDTLLAYSLQAYGSRVVRGVYLPADGQSVSTTQSKTGQCLHGFGYTHVTGDMMRSSAVRWTEPQLFCGTSACGHLGVVVHQNPYPIGIPAFILEGSEPVPALAIEAARISKGLNRDQVRLDEDVLVVGTEKIDLLSHSILPLRYRNCAGEFAHMSFYDVFREMPGGDGIDRRFRDKTVFVGFNSPSYYPHEFSSSPSGKFRTNVTLQADIYSSLMVGYRLRIVRPFAMIILLVLTALAFAVIQLSQSRLFMIAASFMLLLLILSGDCCSFLLGVDLWSVPLLTVGIVMTLSAGVRTMARQESMIVSQKVALESKAREISLIQSEMMVARAIQEDLLPRRLPASRDFEFFAQTIPAQQVSGDFFDFIELDRSFLVFTIGDVSGKGITAALLMATVQAAIRSESQRRSTEFFPCSHVMSAVNSLIAANTTRGQFATIFFGLLNLETRELRYVNAGHLPPIYLGGHAVRAELQEGGLPLGVLPDASYVVGKLILEEQFTLALVTDGITEATNDLGEMYGESRLRNLLEQKSHLSASELAEDVISEVNSFARNQILEDDTTILIIRSRRSPSS